MSDASNTPSNLAPKVVSSSTRPSTTTDKENLPSIDKQHRPITAAIATNTIDHSVLNGTASNGVNNSLLTSSSIDATAANNGQHSLLKTSASGGPPAVLAMASNRSSVTEKIRAQTVRIPGAGGVRRRETIDPVPGGMASRKFDTTDKSKTPTGEAYVYLHCLLFVCMSCCDCLRLLS